MSKSTKHAVPSRPHWLTWGLGLACAAVLAGCASMGSTTPEEAVTQRSNAFWKARMAGEVAKTYALTSPGYRAVNDQEKYRLAHGVIPVLKGGDIAWVKCDEARCEVRKNFTTSSPVMPRTSVPISISEIWIKEEGQWWLFVE
ncbi:MULTISPECIES: hypothetical protein [unclassified Delftia]|uniref:hypothetical protein n=1 Tax=unclassified Delftia TaxID=2613839 RepID=UPI00114F1BB2|nr:MULTISPECIES: hypothetical protein [unclassified Delftia]MCB4789418.1 hypothetical protein [Delftia sp. Lp-1]TQL83733.1 hypothetical protein FB549_1230 [Delftia sp. HK171]